VRAAALAALLAPPQDPPAERLLQRFVGTWDVRLTRAGEAEAAEGRETGRRLEGGLWVVLDHRGRYLGRAYEGRILLGYEPARKKFVGVWVGNFGPGLNSFEGEASGSTLTLWVDCVDARTGERVKERMVYEFPGPGRRTLTFYGRGEDGRERATAVMTFVRRDISR